VKILVVMGTRPEAIKMAPVYKALAARPERFEAVVCLTAQHRELLDQVIEVFGLPVSYDLNLMKPICAGLDPVGFSRLIRLHVFSQHLVPTRAKWIARFRNAVPPPACACAGWLRQESHVLFDRAPDHPPDSKSLSNKGLKYPINTVMAVVTGQSRYLTNDTCPSIYSTLQPPGT